jgi:hypothetical protein
MHEKVVPVILFVAFAGWFAYENRWREAAHEAGPAAENAPPATEDPEQAVANLGAWLGVQPLRDDEPAPKVCQNLGAVMHLMLRLARARPGTTSSSTDTDRGTIWHLSCDRPGDPSSRELVFLLEKEEGPYFLLDDFVSPEQLIAPRLELAGDQLKYADRDSGKVIRQVTCSHLTP